MGVDDPYLGMMAEEAASAQQSTLDSLLMRGFIRGVLEDKFVLEDQISATARVIHQPNHSLIIHSKENSNCDFHCYIHFGNEWIVHHTPNQDQHRLTLVQSIYQLADDLDQALRLGSKAESRGDSFILEEGALFEIRRLCAEGELEKARNRLVAESVPAEVLSPVLHTLREPAATSSFILVVNRNNVESQYVRGFSVIEGAGEMWIMEPYDDDGNPIVTFLAADASKVRERFYSLIPRRSNGHEIR
jgi:hypothetical protein